VVASGSGVQRAAGAAIAFAIVFAAPLAARAGAWTEPQGSGLLIETLFGWVGDGAPWGDNPAVKQNREDAQTYVEYGVTNELTIFGQTALERYALKPADAGRLYGLRLLGHRPAGETLVDGRMGFLRRGDAVRARRL